MTTANLNLEIERTWHSVSRRRRAGKRHHPAADLPRDFRSADKKKKKTTQAHARSPEDDVLELRRLRHNV